MNLDNYKIIFVAVGLIGVLLIASPAFAFLPAPPESERFSELYLLGPGHMIGDYPSNIVPGQSYSLYVGVGNHVGSAAYYVVYVKLLNEAETMPNSTAGTPSSVGPLYEYRLFVQSNQTLESHLTFSVPNATIGGDNSIVRTFEVNSTVFNVNKAATWDVNASAYRYRLLFELWMYNPQSRLVSFNSRFVALQLNLTQTG